MDEPKQLQFRPRVPGGLPRCTTCGATLAAHLRDAGDRQMELLDCADIVDLTELEQRK